MTTPQPELFDVLWVCVLSTFLISIRKKEENDGLLATSTKQSQYSLVFEGSRCRKCNTAGRTRLDGSELAASWQRAGSEPEDLRLGAVGVGGVGVGGGVGMDVSMYK